MKSFGITDLLHCPLHILHYFPSYISHYFIKPSFSLPHLSFGQTVLFLYFPLVTPSFLHSSFKSYTLNLYLKFPHLTFFHRYNALLSLVIIFTSFFSQEILQYTSFIFISLPVIIPVLSYSVSLLYDCSIHLLRPLPVT